MNYFTRLEAVQKSNNEFVIETNYNFIHTIYAINLGASVYVLKSKYTWADIGGMATFNFMNKELETYYGNSPISVIGFVRFVPSRIGSMKM